jgi:hypothetical protein
MKKHLLSAVAAAALCVALPAFAQNIAIVNGKPVPKDPNNPRQGTLTVPLPVSNIIFPGGDTSIISNLEYRFTSLGRWRSRPSSTWASTGSRGRPSCRSTRPPF